MKQLPHKTALIVAHSDSIKLIAVNNTNDFHIDSVTIADECNQLALVQATMMAQVKTIPALSGDERRYVPSDETPSYYAGQVVMARWHSCERFQLATVKYCGKTHGIGFVAVHFDKGFPACLPYENVKVKVMK